MSKGKSKDRAIELRKGRSKWLHDVEREKKKAERRRVEQARYLKKPQGLRERYRSIPLRLMAERCAEQLSSDAVKAGRFQAPKNFSLHHNPQETLREIFKIAKYAKSSRPVLRINVDLRRVTQMDLAADSLLAIVLKEIKNECFNVRRSSIRGTYPSSSELQRELQEIGTIKVLMADPGRDNIEISLNEDVKVFRYRQTGSEIIRTLDASDTVESVTEKFANHVNRCLGTIGYELTEMGRRNLCDYVGEVLTNAQEHAGIKDWTIVGYLDVDAKIFKTAVINFGKSYEDTFVDLEEDSYAWCQVKGYLQRHADTAQKKYGLSKGSLLTVAALQGKVSSKNLSSADTRGQGTVAMIEFFQRIHDVCSGHNRFPTEMAVISGSTHITFDGLYRLKKDDRTGRDVIAFNGENDLRKLPDGKVVKTMPGVHFPGTIISINFPLTPKLQIREIES